MVANGYTEQEKSLLSVCAVPLYDLAYVPQGVTVSHIEPNKRYPSRTPNMHGCQLGKGF